MTINQLKQLYKQLDLIINKPFTYLNINEHFKYFKDYNKEHIDNVLLFTKDNIKIEFKVVQAYNFIVIDYVVNID